MKKKIPHELSFESECDGKPPSTFFSKVRALKREKIVQEDKEEGQ